MELWKFSYSWEKISKAQTRRSTGATCSGNSRIEFPFQKQVIVAGWPRRRDGAGRSRTGPIHGSVAYVNVV